MWPSLCQSAMSFHILCAWSAVASQMYLRRTTGQALRTCGLRRCSMMEDCMGWRTQTHWPDLATTAALQQEMSADVHNVARIVT